MEYCKKIRNRLQTKNEKKENIQLLEIDELSHDFEFKTISFSLSCFHLNQNSVFSKCL